MVTDENTNATSSQQSGTILVLKHDLHCLGFDKRVLVGGACGINLSLLFAAGLKNPNPSANQNVVLYELKSI